MSSVTAVCVLYAPLPDIGARHGPSGIDKRPVEGPRAVGRLGLEGDRVFNIKDHGGPDKAVYAYAAEDAAAWAAELGRPVPPGLFGENLRTAGVDVSGALVGERWRVGGVLLEVRMPRVPCGTFAQRMGERGWVRTFTQRGWPGAYLAVLEPGELAAGDAVDVVHRPAHGVRIGPWSAHRAPDDARALAAAEAAGEISIAEDLRDYVEQALF